jgi:hypothetical protein
MNAMGYRTVALLLFLTVLCFGAEFVSTPVIADSANGINIRFSVSEPAIVTVEVVDTNDQTVAYIASGLLGDNAPAPFVSGSLSQSLYWDKTDDGGNVWTQAYKVKVGLGLKAEYQRTIGWNPQNALPVTGWTKGLTVDSDGNVTVLNVSKRGRTRMVTFSPDGSYLRTVHPYPGNLPESRLSGFGRMTRSDGKKIPLYYQAHEGTMVPELHNARRQSMAVTPDGWIVMANSIANQQWYGFQTTKSQLLIFDGEGGCPRDTVFGPLLSPQSDVGEIHLALAPDSQTVFATGLQTGQYETNANTANIVLKSALNTTAQASIFAGAPYTAGSDDSHFNNPSGLAIDAAYRVYVSDSGNHRIVVLDSTGTVLQTKAIASPDMLQLNPNTGELFVLSIDNTLKRAVITKLSAYPDLDSIASLNIPCSYITKYRPVMALSFVTDPVTLWFGPLTYADLPTVTAIEDLGTSLALNTSRTIGKRLKEGWLGRAADVPGYITLSQDEEYLYAGGSGGSTGKEPGLARVDLATGTVTRTTIKAGEAEFGQDDYLYVWGKGGWKDSVMYKYDKQGNKVNFANGQDHFLTTRNLFNGVGLGSRGLAVSASGEIYIGRQDASGTNFQDNTNVIGVYDQSGNLLRDSIYVSGAGMPGFQVDRQGNLYTGYNARPKSVIYPSTFEAAGLPDPFTTTASMPWNWDKAYLNYYLFSIGSIFKFPAQNGGVLVQLDNPGGGEYIDLSTLPEGDLNGSEVPPVQIDGIYRKAIQVNNAIWQHHGMSGMSSPSNFGDQGCQCFSPRFSLDRFGRIVYPDPMTASVVVLDNNGNELYRFGEYGNPDELSSTSEPEKILLGYPMYVRSHNRNVYISDVGNQRVEHVRLTPEVVWDNVAAVDQRSLPKGTDLALNLYPTPFNPELKADIVLPEAGDLTVTVYAPSGKRIRTIHRYAAVAGRQTLSILGRQGHAGLASGLYLVRLEMAGQVKIQRALLVR